MTRAIPVVTAGALAAGEAGALEALRLGFGEFGILHVAEHGLEPPFLDELYGTFQAFRASPTEVKDEVLRPDLWYQRGWTPPNTEVALSAGGTPDFKECYFACCTGQRDEDRALFPEIHADNVWPRGFPAFPAHYERVARALQALGLAVLSACERALDLAPGTITARLDHGPHVTRLLAYLPVGQREGVLWGENHTDFCALTLLPGGRFVGPDGQRRDPPDDGSGLFQQSRGGERVRGTPPPGCLAVQIGQQLEVLTGGALLATPHEVRAPRAPDLARLSCAHFMHLHPLEQVFPLPPFRSDDAVQRYRPPVLAGTYDLKVLVDIGLAPPSALERLGYSNQDRVRPGSQA